MISLPSRKQQLLDVPPEDPENPADGTRQGELTLTEAGSAKSGREGHRPLERRNVNDVNIHFGETGHARGAQVFAFEDCRIRMQIKPQFGRWPVRKVVLLRAVVHN